MNGRELLSAVSVLCEWRQVKTKYLKLQYARPYGASPYGALYAHLINGLLYHIHARDDSGGHQRLPLPVLHKRHLGVGVADVHEL